MKQVGHAWCSSDKRNAQKIVVKKHTETKLFRLRRPRYVNNKECLSKTWPSTRICIFLIFCWPCISIYLFLYINQLDALNFIISLFQVSTCFEHTCSSSGGQNFLIVLSQSVHGTATYRCDDTRDCIIQFCPPDDEHVCSKQVEAWNKLIIKFSSSSWLILRSKEFVFLKLLGM